jgi:hypothetical protein
MDTFGLPRDLEEAKLLIWPFFISLWIALAIQITGNDKYRGLFPKTGSEWHLAVLRFSATISVLFSLFGIVELIPTLTGISFVFALINLVLGYSAPRRIRGPMLAAGWGSLGILTFGSTLIPAVGR